MLQSQSKGFSKPCKHAVLALGMLALVMGAKHFATYAQYGNYGNYGNYGSYSPPSVAVATDVTITRTCYNAYQQQLKSTDPDPAEYYHYNGDWVAYDTAKGTLMEDGKIGLTTNYIMYWRPNKHSPVDPTVYVVGKGFGDKNGFANYGTAGYCTGWSSTKFPVQKEMRCWSNRALNKAYWGWANADGIRGMPADPGKSLALEPDLVCSGINPGEWKWLKDLEPVKTSSSSSSSAAVQPATTDATDAGVEAPPAKKEPLYKLLKKKK